MNRVIILTGIFLTFSLQTAFAHTKSQSFSSWQVDGASVEAVFAVDARRITQLAQLYDELPSLEAMLTAHVIETIVVQQDGLSCTGVVVNSNTSGTSTHRVALRFSCPDEIADTGGTVRIGAFHTVSATHLHIARVFADADSMGREYILHEGSATFLLKGDKTPRNLFEFIRLGFFHVLSGLDHLAFLAALVLVANTPRRAILCISGFTVGHSITLAGATLGIIQPAEHLIEAMIGFTIAATALDALPDGHRRQAFWLLAAATGLATFLPVGGGSSAAGVGIFLVVFSVTFGQLTKQNVQLVTPLLAVAFGLIHGAGFAGGLTELHLTHGQVFLPLLGFNVGVELGQLLALLILYAIGYIHSCKFPHLQLQVRPWMILVLFGAGLFWFTERIWQ